MNWIKRNILGGQYDQNQYLTTQPEPLFIHRRFNHTGVPFQMRSSILGFLLKRYGLSVGLRVGPPPTKATSVKNDVLKNFLTWIFSLVNLFVINRLILQYYLIFTIFS